MQTDEIVLEIPYGTRDFLPHEAAEKRGLETVLADLFAAWGYDEIVTPTIEYLDTLTMGNGQALEPHMFKFFDKNNRTLALRHEMTTPIARVTASRLKDETLPLKLSYISSVYRYEQTQTGRQCEFYQAGVEFMGSGTAAADAEVIALAAEGLLKAGLKDFQICLGQVEFINGIMQQFRLSAGEQEKIKAAMEKRNLVGLESILEQTTLAKSAKELLRKLPLLHGGEDVLAQAYDMAVTEQSRRALDNLAAIYHLLEDYGIAEHVQFDLGVIRDFNYYTGMVFEVYTRGLGFPLCGGGRYDHMLSDFGAACPATGFALGIERMMLALERQGLSMPKIRKDIYVGYAEGKLPEALKQAMAYRRQGKVVELAPGAQAEREAALYQKGKGYQQLVYLP